MPFARNQLRHYADRLGIGRQTQLSAEAFAVTGDGEGSSVHAAAYRREPGWGYARVNEHLTNRVRDSNDFCRGTVFCPRQPPRFPVVHPSGDHCRHAGQAGGDHTPDVGTAPRVQVDDIGLVSANRPVKAPHGGNIRIPPPLDRLSRGNGSHRRQNLAIGRCCDDVGHAARRETAHKVQHLQRAPVEVTSGLHVKHLHAGFVPCCGSRLSSRSITSPTPMPVMQV